MPTSLSAAGRTFDGGLVGGRSMFCAERECAKRIARQAISCEQGRLPIGRRIPSCPTVQHSWDQAKWGSLLSCGRLVIGPGWNPHQVALISYRLPSSTISLPTPPAPWPALQEL